MAEPTADPDHHIKPFGNGGPTADDNLIALCRRCHEGLDPHDQPWLFWYSGAPMYRALDELDAEAHDKGVEAYRRLMARAIDRLDRREHVTRVCPAGTTPSDPPDLQTEGSADRMGVGVVLKRGAGLR